MTLALKDDRFVSQTGVRYPIIGGPMYPCSNPELVAEISNAGGLGVIQPLSLTYVYGYDFKQGLETIRRLTDQPLGMNALIEKSSKRHLRTMQQWVDIALQQGIGFILTSLGKPDWVVRAAHQAGALVYHDATEAKWAAKAVDCGVDGLIAVNNRAGGHAGERSAEALYKELAGFGLPLVGAGGVATREKMQHMLDIGYAAVQMGTIFIASEECRASAAYKQGIIDAQESDIILTQRLTGVNVSIIKPRQSDAAGEFGPLVRKLLKYNWSKHWMRFFLFMRSMRNLKSMIATGKDRVSLWQAGKSAADIHKVRPVSEIVRDLTS